MIRVELYANGVRLGLTATAILFFILVSSTPSGARVTRHCTALQHVPELSGPHPARVSFFTGNELRHGWARPRNAYAQVTLTHRPDLVLWLELDSSFDFSSSRTMTEDLLKRQFRTGCTGQVLNPPPVPIRIWRLDW